MNSVIHWLTTYSSIIQTFCAVLGLVIGLFALLFAIHQINISQKQREFQLTHDYIYDNTNILIQIENIETRIQLTKIEINESIDEQDDEDIKFKLLNKIQDLDDLLPDLIEIKKYFSEKTNNIFLNKVKLTIGQLEQTLTERMKALNFIAVANRSVDKIIRINDAMIKLAVITKKIEAEQIQILEKLAKIESLENDSPL
jgi:hypothetical protein